MKQIFRKEEESEDMLGFLPLLNLLIFIGLLVGIPWFMISVVGLLKKIESRLENLERSMKNNKIEALEVHNDSF